MASQKMWKKRVLIPLWVIELIVMGIFFILAAIIVGYTDEYLDRSIGREALLASGGAVMGLSGFTILLTLIEIGLLAGRRLNPVFHLTSACIKTVIWLVWFILNVASSAYVGSSSALDIVLSLIVAICSIAQLIYGSIIVHRVRKGFYCNQNNVASSTCNVASSAGGYGYDNNIYSAEMDMYPRKNVSSDDSRV